MKKHLLTFGVCLLLSASRFTAAETAQTWADFTAAVAAAEDGATVYVENDLAWDSVLPPVNKRVTIRSRGDARFVLSRAPACNDRLLFQRYGTCAAGDVTLENLIVDGAGSPSTLAGDPFYVEEGRLTLGAGCTIRNFQPKSAGLVVDLTGVLTMEDGAEITGFEGQANASIYGVVVRVGNGYYKEGVHPGTGSFVMNGGAIHGNADNCTTNDLYLGGIVYVYTGAMYFNGGLIASNRSARACGGVLVYAGNLHVKGSGSIIDNVGGTADDLAFREGKIFVDGLYTGRMTYYQATADNLKMWDEARGWFINVDVFPEWADYGTGSNQALNVSCQGRPNLVVAPYNRGYNSHFWAERIAVLDDGRVFCVNAASLTVQNAYNTLLKAVEAAADGGAVALTRDLQIGQKASLPGHKNYTLTSYGPERRVVSRVPVSADTQHLLIVSNAAVRVENLVLDGSSDTDANHVCDANMVKLTAAGARFTLGPGGVIRNAWTKLAPSVVYAEAKGAGLTMEEGSLIENCGAWGASSYGSVIRVGSNGSYSGDDAAAFFDMKGGAITRCASQATNTDAGYGGVVYLYNGVFRMSGGAITNNVDGVNGCAGVYAYVGNVYVSGDARIADNTGAYPGVRMRSVNATRVTVSGDFRGHVQLASGKQELGETAGVVVAPGADSTPFSGAWNLEPSRTTSETPLVGALENEAVVWRAAIGGIDAVAAATEADLQTVWEQMGPLRPTADGSGTRVLSGRAKELDWTLDVVFDPLVWRASPSLPFTLVRADEGVLSGETAFSFPACKGGQFTAYASPTGDARLMTFVKNGLCVIVQ